MEKTRIAVFVSGGGTNLQALIDAQKTGILKSGEIVLVLSSARNAYALTRAENADIDTETVPVKEFASHSDFEVEIQNRLCKHRIDLIVLAGFMSILSASFTAKYPGRIINVHPSLIPAFCGKGFYGLRVHEAALACGVKVTGATVHFVNEVPDGGEIILQKAVDIQPGDTPETLQRRVMEQAEWILLPRAAELVSRNIQKENSMHIYDTPDIASRLVGNSYVGRGIVIGKSADGKHAVCAYFIMGRSANSRNRVFDLQDGVLYTKPFDVTKVEDPSLIIYAAIRSCKNSLIVTNGDQTDTIYEGLCRGESFAQSLRIRAFEPDSPNFTPRISGVLSFAENGFSYSMSILKSADSQGSACNRYTFDFSPLPGVGHFIHTYECDGNPIPTFQGEPERICIGNEIDAFTDEIWANLDAENKISLYTRYTDLTDGSYTDRLINKNK